jgi:hypothetical protein
MGVWNHKICTWTGNDVANRLIPVEFDLTVGLSAVWIWPLGSLNNCFRHNLMSGGTIVSGITTIVPPATGGITSFETNGFKVKDNGAFPSVNQGGIQYTALVVRDTSGAVLGVGAYHGNGQIGPTTVGVTFNDDIVVGGINTWNVNRYVLMTLGAFSDTFQLFGYIDSGHFLINEPWPASNGTATMSAANVGQTITVAPLTHAFVFGRSQVFRSPEFAGTDSVHLPINAASLTTQITGAAGSLLSVGVHDNVNNDALQYYWFTINNTVGAMSSVFASFKATGTGSNLDVALPFTPGWAVARPFDAGAGPENVWRGPLDSGVNSHYVESGVTSAGGIRAFDTNKLTLGTLTAPSGRDVYGFALLFESSPGLGYVELTIPVTVGDVDPTEFAAGPANIVADEGRGLIINVDDTSRWFLNRFDLRRRREEHKG